MVGLCRQKEMIKDYFKISLKNLRVRPLRSWLTILGIVIGVFLIISLLSLSEGLKGAIMRELKMMGGDLIFVFPGEIGDMMTTFMGGLKISENDIAAIKRAPGVEVVVPMPWGASIARHQEETKPLLMVGTNWSDSLSIFQSEMGWDLVAGRWPSPGRREIVIGNAVPKDVFPGIKPGNRLTIKGKPFEVAGVLRSLGNRQDDMMVYLDMDYFQQITGIRDGAQTVLVKVATGYDVEEVAQNISFQLENVGKRRRGEEIASFSVITSEKVSDMVGNVMAIVQLAIIGFASIAVLVGGIGIMNTMYTSVYERTREIGILKAVGAKRKSIVMIFLIESGIIGLIGGIGGVVLGIGFAKVIEIFARFHPVFYIEASASPLLIIFGLSFSFLVGCLSGYFPARQAANFKPVDALRYE